MFQSGKFTGFIAPELFRDNQKVGKSKRLFILNILKDNC